MFRDAGSARRDLTLTTPFADQHRLAAASTKERRQLGSET